MSPTLDVGHLLRSLGSRGACENAQRAVEARREEEKRVAECCERWTAKTLDSEKPAAYDPRAYPMRKSSIAN